MKTRTYTLLAALLLVLAQPAPAADALSDTLQKGLFEEEANQNLDAAIKAYQAVLQQTDEQRKLAATAVFRLGECYRKLGKTNEATAQYERILREFSDQNMLADLSRQNLVGLGAASKALPSRALSKGARLEQKRLLEQEIKLLEQQQESIKARFAAGVASHDELTTNQRDLLELRRQLVGLDLAAEQGGPDFDGAGQGASTDEEEREVQRIKALIKDSPDLINAPGQSGGTPLHDAAAAGQLVVARFLLANKADVNARVRGGKTTPLHYAAGRGHKSMVEFLLAHGADVNALGDPSAGGGSALHAAVEQGYKSVAEVLIANKADVNARDQQGDTPLHDAARAGQTPAAELLLANGAEVSAKDSSGMTPLHLAVESNHLPLVELLLSRKASVSPKGDGRTPSPLFLAIGKKNVAVADILLRNGANEEVKGKDGNSLLRNAFSTRSVEMLKLLLAYKPDLEARSYDGLTLLQAAVVESANRDLPLQVIELLLKAGANLNAPFKPLERHERLNPRGQLGGPTTQGVDITDSTSLIVATLRERADVVEALLASGAQINAKSLESKTALHYAVEKGSLPIVQAILAHHPDTEIRDQQGFTPLLRASVQEPKVMEALIEAGADVNAQSPDGKTALHYAVEKRSLPMVRTILAAHPKMEVRDKEGATPFLQAGIDDPAIVQALSDAGADVNAASSSGNTLLHWAASARRKDIVELLVTNKADVNAINKEGDTPLVLAQRRYGPSLSLLDRALQDEIAAFLLKHGADENIRRRSFISVSRKERNLSSPVFFKGTNSYNRYTLLEFMAASYGNPRPVDLPFPDFTNAKIKRLSSTTGTNLEISLDLDKIFKSGDCSNDVWLEWGDVVEIPELDHGVSENWPGLSQETAEMLKKCLQREVEIVVKGEHFKSTLLMTSYNRPGRQGFGGGPGIPAPLSLAPGAPPVSVTDSWKTIRSFRLKEVINQANVVRISSDLSHVKVKRADPRTGQTQEMLFNLSEGAPYDVRTDLWLRDGDVIEVPEK